MTETESSFEQAVMEQRENKAEAAEKDEKSSSLVSVIAAIVGNVLIGLVKFVAAFISGSSAMLAEGIHSIVDCGDGILVLYGIHASKRSADIDHPFGYGKELYFFSFIVALFIFALGGGVSIFKGVTA